jgi:hypothetical protein
MSLLKKIKILRFGKTKAILPKKTKQIFQKKEFPKPSNIEELLNIGIFQENFLYCLSNAQFERFSLCAKGKLSGKVSRD